MNGFIGVGEGVVVFPKDVAGLDSSKGFWNEGKGALADVSVDGSRTER